MSIHTYRRQGRFWFRFVVPPRLVHLYGDEIRFTRSTFNRTVAQELATACWHRCRQLLQADPASLGINSAALDSKQLNRVITSSEEHFTAEFLYTIENNRRLMLWYDEFTVCLHQLLTPKNIDKEIVDRLKVAASPTVSVPSLSMPVARKPSPFLSAEISAYCEKDVITRRK